MDQEFYKVELEGTCHDDESQFTEIFSDKNAALDFILETYKDDKNWAVERATIYKCDFEKYKLTERQCVLDLTYDDLDKCINKKYYDICEQIENKKYAFDKDDLKELSDIQLSNVSERLKYDVWQIKDLDKKLHLVQITDDIEVILKERDLEKNKNIENPQLSHKNELEEAI